MRSYIFCFSFICMINLPVYGIGDVPVRILGKDVIFDEYEFAQELASGLENVGLDLSKGRDEHCFEESKCLLDRLEDLYRKSKCKKEDLKDLSSMVFCGNMKNVLIPLVGSAIRALCDEGVIESFRSFVDRIGRVNPEKKCKEELIRKSIRYLESSVLNQKVRLIIFENNMFHIKTFLSDSAFPERILVHAYLEEFLISSHKLCFLFWRSVQYYLSNKKTMNWSDFNSCLVREIDHLRSIVPDNVLLNILSWEPKNSPGRSFHRFFVCGFFDVLKKELESSDEGCAFSALERKGKIFVLYALLKQLNQMAVGMVSHHEHSPFVLECGRIIFGYFIEKYGVCDKGILAPYEYVYRYVISELWDDISNILPQNIISFKKDLDVCLNKRDLYADFRMEVVKNAISQVRGLYKTLKRKHLSLYEEQDVHYSDALLSLAFKVLDPSFVVHDVVFGDAAKFIGSDDIDFFQMNLKKCISEEYTLVRFLYYCLRKENIHLFSSLVSSLSQEEKAEKVLDEKGKGSLRECVGYGDMDDKDWKEYGPYYLQNHENFMYLKYVLGAKDVVRELEKIKNNCGFLRMMKRKLSREDQSGKNYKHLRTKYFFSDEEK